MTKNKKKLFTNWENVGQKKGFKRMLKTVDKDFKRLHRTIDKDFKQMRKTVDKDFGAATEDFRTVGPTQKRAYVPSQKVTMGTINPKKARERRRKR